jgi:hypothetical protein
LWSVGSGWGTREANSRGGDSAGAHRPHHPPSPPQDDLLDALYWLRQLLALFLGLAAGAGAHTGLPVFLAHLAITAVLPLAWARSQGVDDDVVGGVGPLMNEGVGPAVGLFTLSWILSYTQAVAKAAG